MDGEKQSQLGQNNDIVSSSQKTQPIYGLETSRFYNIIQEVLSQVPDATVGMKGWSATQQTLPDFGYLFFNT